MTSRTLFEITNADDEEAELYLRSAIEQVAFISKLDVISITVDPHDRTRGITASVESTEPMHPVYAKGVSALVHVQCPDNKAIRINYIVNNDNY